jgi:hypothetical protein
MPAARRDTVIFSRRRTASDGGLALQGSLGGPVGAPTGTQIASQVSLAGVPVSVAGGGSRFRDVGRNASPSATTNDRPASGAERRQGGDGRAAEWLGASG